MPAHAVRDLALAFLVSACAAPGLCRSMLYETLNGPVLDQHTNKIAGGRHATITADEPVGQTFVTGEDVVEVFRVAVWQVFWHESWEPDEALVMTLWDSPKKAVSYGRFAIPYARRMWEGAVPMFTLQARVEPKRSYYFELTVETEPLRPAETPREWLRSGKRPGLAGGDGKIVGIGTAEDRYPHGQAFIGGRPQSHDLWFQIHARKKPDPAALYEEAFARFDLEYPPLAPLRDAVEQRDWERAIDVLIEHFEGRTDLVPPERRRVAYNPQYDTRASDAAADQKVLLDDGTPIDLGPEWNHFAFWPEQQGVGIARSGLRQFLASGYVNTGNEKYARAWNDMLEHFFIHCPSPVRAGVFAAGEPVPATLPPGLAGGSMWSGPSLAAQMNHGFAFYANFADSPHFTRDMRAAFILNLDEMAQVLERQRGTDGWQTQMADALFDFGLDYPEFKRARAWVKQGFDGLIENTLATVRPDGVLQEPTMNDHLPVLNRYSQLLEKARRLQLDLPEPVVALTQKMADFVVFSTLPDGTLPVWGDGNHPVRPAILERPAKLFNRDDCRFILTRGAEGTTPSHTSMGFPDGGFYYMRSGWGRDAHYLGIHAGPQGSHGHRDALSVIAAAFGRTILIDPGVSERGTPASSELAASPSHNTITVDNRDNRNGVATTWVTSQHFDFFAGRNDGYDGLPNVRHHRRIWFLKPLQQHGGFWVIFDDVAGPGQHSATLRYRFAPLTVRHNGERGQVWSEGTGGNLLVSVAEPGRMQMRMGRGIAVWNGLTQVPVASFSQTGSLPLAFSSLLLPFRGKAPIVNVLPIEVQPAAEGARALWAERSDEAALIVGNALTTLRHEEPAELQLVLPGVQLVRLAGAGAALRFRRQAGAWHPASLHGIRIRSMSLGIRRLVSGETLQQTVDIVFPD